MDLINLNRDERILFNRAKIKYLQDNIDAGKVTNAALALYLLKKYMGGKK